MDAIADMLTIIRNGYLAKKPDISVPHSKFKLEIARVLEKQNYIGKVQKKESSINIELSYENKKPKITQIKKVSKQGSRIHTKSKHLKPVKGGRGDLIVSTPEGAMTAKDAKKKNLGGEVICEVW